MTRIDRYILVVFVRTFLICFSSLAGIFVVFHAFDNMDDFLRRAAELGPSGSKWVLIRVMTGFYRPYLLLLFDSMGAIIALMSVLFTAGWLRRTGELSAMLAAGISHGRILRPMILAATALILVQTINRECVLPTYAHSLALKSKPGEKWSGPVLAQYDKLNRILIDGETVTPVDGLIENVSLRIDGKFDDFPGTIHAARAVWIDAIGDAPSGYRVSGITTPESIRDYRSISHYGRTIIATPRDHDGLADDECFVATTVHCDYLGSNDSARKLAPLTSLIGRVRNPAVHSASSLRVLLHARLVRTPLDIALVCLVLPIAASLAQRNLFVMMGSALLTVVSFFVLKTIASGLGGGGYLASAALAGWLPLLIVGPIGYARYRAVQCV